MRLGLLNPLSSLNWYTAPISLVLRWLTKIALINPLT